MITGRILTEAEVKVVRRRLRSIHIKDAPIMTLDGKNTGLRLSQTVTYNGKEWTIYDVNADVTQPKGITLALVRDNQLHDYVPLSEVNK